MVKPAVRREKTVGTRVTEEEYSQLEALAGGQNMSEWVRDLLFQKLARAGATPAEEILLAEVVALRTVVYNVLFKVANGEKITEQEMRQLIERADAAKRKKALDRLSQK